MPRKARIQYPGAIYHLLSRAIWVYYATANNYIERLRIRHVKVGVYNEVGGSPKTLTVKDCLFEEITGTGSAGIAGIAGNAYYLTVTGLTKCNVTTPGASMTDSPCCAKMAFKGIDSSSSDDDSVPVADTMGAIGPNEFVEIVNGKIAIFDKANGTRTAESGLNAFFTIAQESRLMADPRILYDHFHQQWVASAVDRLTWRVIVAVRSSTNFSLGGWTKFELPVERSNRNSDFPTLALDKNGIYLSVCYWTNLTQLDGNTVIAIKSPEIYQGSLYWTNYAQSVADINSQALYAAFNFDDPPADGLVWFVAKSSATGTGTNYLGGPLRYRCLKWSGTNAVWVHANGWQTLVEPNPTYRNYFDLDSGSVFAPQLGQTASIGLQLVGSRLGMATIRSGYLWTCQTVGLDGTDSDYDGSESGSTVDRSAIQYLKLQLDSGNTNLTFSLHGRIYSSASGTPPYYYYMPSLAVNSSGDLLCGFSGSRSDERISAFLSGRRGSGATPARPILIQGGRDFCNPNSGNRWGDYSHTSIDPETGRFWTVQEYSELREAGQSVWGTWIASFDLP